MPYLKNMSVKRLAELKLKSQGKKEAVIAPAPVKLNAKHQAIQAILQAQTEGDNKKAKILRVAALNAMKPKKATPAPSARKVVTKAVVHRRGIFADAI